MTFELTLHVTQDHISRGAKEDACNCPIALAIKEQLPNRQDVQVDGDVRVRVLDEEFAWNGGELVDEFVAKFDEGLPVEPFTTRALFVLQDSWDD